MKPCRLTPGHVSLQGLFGSAVYFEHVCVEVFDQVHLRRRGFAVLRYREPQKQVLPVPPHVPRSLTYYLRGQLFFLIVTQREKIKIPGFVAL